MKFKPTYLYVKQHSVTGKLYFGKTIKKDPVKYLGSGLHWTRHLHKYGKEHVVTLWYELFIDHAECMKFALEFSEKMDIVNSDQWLNLRVETGVDDERGPDSEETRLKKSLALKDVPRTEEAKQNMRGPRGPMSEEGKRIRSISGKGNQLGIPKSSEQRVKISSSLKGRKRGGQLKVICPHCSKEGGVGLMKRYHFQNCSKIIKEMQCKELSNGLTMPNASGS